MCVYSKMMHAVQNLGILVNNESTLPKFRGVHEIMMLWQCNLIRNRVSTCRWKSNGCHPKSNSGRSRVCSRYSCVVYTHTYIMYIYIIYPFIDYTSSTAQGGGGSFKNRKPIGEVGCCESRMAELFLWLSTYLPTYRPTDLPTYL